LQEHSKKRRHNSELLTWRPCSSIGVTT
jgi:hypothetical protein